MTRRTQLRSSSVWGHIANGVTLPPTAIQPTGAGITRWQDATGADFQTKLGTVGTNALSLQVGTTYDISDFTQGGGVFGVLSDRGATGLLGAGAQSTIVELAPNSMTGTAPSTGTNSFSVVTFNHVDSPVVDGWTLRGTTQKSLYNGLRFQYCDNPTVRNMLVTNIPGNFTSPPGETFFINHYNASGGTFDTIECDGSNGSPSDPSKWGSAAMLGTNTTTGKIVINRLYAHEAKWSKSWAGWQGVGGGQMNEIWTINTYYGIGFEEMSGTYYLDDCVWGGNVVDIHLGHSSVYNGGSPARLIIRNPVLLGGKTKVVVFIPPSYTGGQAGATGTNTQQASDVQILTGSDAAGWTDVTSSMLQVQTAYPTGGGYYGTPLTNYTKPAWRLAP